MTKLLTAVIKILLPDGPLADVAHPSRLTVAGALEDRLDMPVDEMLFLPIGSANESCRFDRAAPAKLFSESAKKRVIITPLSLTGQDNANSDVDDNEMVMPTVSNLNPASSVSRYQISPPHRIGHRRLFSWPKEGVYNGLQVYMVGHLMPKENTANGGRYGQVWNSPSDSSGSSSAPNINTASFSNSSASFQKLRVCRSTYIPGWSVPPRTDRSSLLMECLMSLSHRLSVTTKYAAERPRTAVIREYLGAYVSSSQAYFVSWAYYTSRAEWIHSTTQTNTA
ncbi:hypothetical protein BDZ89DRAFT_1131681 [Hymenopellis radicata]|nr:hypothetical protein BDZ89DRAFT_1131681 [Hymenopellis radicata]